MSDSNRKFEKPILFLGYDGARTKLINFLQERRLNVQHSAEPIADLSSYGLVISFGYRHILKKAVLDTATRPVINLHISYLPYNRGADPNFWSFYENTPSGVTIHEMDEGLDTGPIIIQKKVAFDVKETTFKQTHVRLIQEIEQLFIDNWASILRQQYVVTEQIGSGTYHSTKDMPIVIEDWDSDIVATIKQLTMHREHRGSN